MHPQHEHTGTHSSTQHQHSSSTAAAQQQHSNAMKRSSLLRLVSPSSSQHLNETLAALVKGFGDAASPHLDMGIFGTTYVFDVLRAHDLEGVALAILNQTTYPSFGYMIDQVKSSVPPTRVDRRAFS